MSEDRLVHIERRVSDLAGNIDRFDGKLDAIADSLSSLVRIEERQITINERLAAGQKTMQEHTERIHAIEVKLPPLQEARGWLVAAILAILGLVGHAIMGVVVK